MANNSGMSFCWPPTYQRISSDMLCGFDGVVERGLAVGLARERGVDVPALPRPVLRPLGHERGHHAVTLREDLGVGLEQRAAVRGFERLAILDGRFEHARAGLGVQAFERDAQRRCTCS